MRIAIVSDIHGNLIAFEAVIADLRQTAPDLIFHGGDLAHGGSSPSEVVDRIRTLGWPGVMGNTDEMLPCPESLENFAKDKPPNLQPLFDAIREIAQAARESLGEDRLNWLRDLPRLQVQDTFALVHASPESLWSSPTHRASDAEIQSVYGSLARPVAVYGHIHYPFIRTLQRMTAVNTGSVSLSYDGDRCASYLLLDDLKPSIRRVEYNVFREIEAMQERAIPHADWIAKTLQTASPQLP